ncbi:AAA family ATPase [Undibacterium sp. Di26W]|uniref:AAA family ATPase n=1 Tax=Undibacterium sp. Di26W TaxID=3413035 RepID=UPI003BF1DAFB
MMLKKLAQLFPGKISRVMLIALLTLFIASAILTPKLNPITRGRILAAENFGAIWSDLNQWRVALAEARSIEDGWPKDINKYAPPAITPYLVVSSPQPYVLQADIVKNADLGSLSGTQVIFDINPNTATWRCKAGSPPIPSGFLPINCDGGSTSEPGFGVLKMLLVFCAFIFVTAGLFLLSHHPLLGPTQLRPERLRRTPYRILPKLDRLLRLAGRRQSTLQAATVSMSDWQRAVNYVNDSASQRAACLAKQLGAQCKAGQDWTLPGEVFEWQFASNLPISLDRCLVFIPSEDLDEDSLIRCLVTAQTGSDVMLILSEHAPDTPMPLLQAYCEDRANMFVMLDSASQTECLLSRQATAILLRLLAAQLRVTRISPYQTRGAITSSGAFFGRDQLLARVIGREPANYLVVGGRQLGKSSLLKAVQRRLQGHPQIICHYISLRDHRLAPRMALQFGLAATTPIEDIIAHLETNFSGKRLFLLIDEADQFFRDEAQNGYQQLSALRALSDEGRCWFMLAGFWDLYATAVLDYQSPLRNFGEVLTIGGLEQEACRELASVPLSRLRFGFSSNHLIDQLVEASGQRANLLAILCQECLEVLQPGERAIDARHTALALSSQAVQDALAGWGRLSHDEDACRLDRIVVYHTALHGKTSLSELAALLESAGGHQTQPEPLRHALARLQLAYVLKREGAEFVFAIPLLIKQFEQSEVALLLKQELSSMHTTAAI